MAILANRIFGTWVLAFVPFAVDGLARAEGGDRPEIRVGGEFDAFKLFAKGALGGTSPMNTFYAGKINTTYWYAPSARAIVKSVHHGPYLGTTIMELVAVQRGP